MLHVAHYVDCLCVCVFVSSVKYGHIRGPYKTAEAIDLPFVMLTWACPRNHVIRWGPKSPLRKGPFWGTCLGIP